LRLFSFGGYGLAFAALALVVFGAYDSYRIPKTLKKTTFYFIFLFFIFLLKEITNQHGFLNKRVTALLSVA